MMILSYWNEEKSYLTTKFTKDTKNLENYILKLRALRALRGENYPFFFGCGYTALGLLRPNPKPT
jgi:hypothetical protein